MRPRLGALPGLSGIALLLGGCCGEAPRWEPLAPVDMVAGGGLRVDLADRLEGKGGEDLTFRVASSDPLIGASVEGGELVLAADAAAAGSYAVELVAEDGCGQQAEAALLVEVAGAAAESCLTAFTYAARAGASQVYLAGAFNGWSPSATPMAQQADGSWAAEVALAPGSWPYKIVELTGAGEQWSCDPGGEQFQCDAGYTWDPSCPVGGGGCNSMVVVPDCSLPVLTVDALEIDRAGGRLSLTVTASGAPMEGAWATLDGAPLDGWSGGTFTAALSGLSGRHTIRLGGTDALGRPAEEVYVPAWFDDGSWEQGLLYYVFVDRFSDGDSSNNAAEGTSGVGGDYAGGDWAGVMDRLDYLQDLGVTAIWLTAPWDNAEGAWAGSCGVTASGYHGYWPDSVEGLEEHFGDEAQLEALIAAAHDRGIRVLVDWVGNHVHEDHPWYTDHPDWFNPRFICEEDEDGNGVSNWDQRPETCWFASYLPDIDYYNPDALTASVDVAVDFAKRYGLDGFRVDAVKHMPQSVHWDMQARVRRELEHRDAAGNADAWEDFYTVGETFSGDRGLIAAYVGDNALDGQFDFPLYWSVVQAFAREEIPLTGGGSLAEALAASEGAFAGMKMSVFLGNHDVWRFIAQASGEVGSLYGDGNCDGSNRQRPPDDPPGDSAPYDRLRLAWTFLLTQPGLPLIYYGDEIGLPGWADPDNRQQMRFDGDLSAEESGVLRAVQALGQARLDHPALSAGSRQTWWEEPELWAWARRDDLRPGATGDTALVLINRSAADRVLTNGLAFAGLPSGAWVDLLTGDRFAAAGDQLTVSLPARSSRVLVPE